MDILRLKGLQFFGRHGTEEWEKETGRRFTVDLELHADFQEAGESDHLEDAYDYRTVYACAKNVVEGESHELIGRIAWRVMEEIFQTFPVQAVQVRVGKPEAPIGGINQATEIEYTRAREEWERTR